MRVKSPLVSIAAAVVASLLILGCAPSAQPGPTSVPAQPTKAVAAQPTAAPSQSTAAPAAQSAATLAPKVDFPAKGKAIQLIVPQAAGSAADAPARIMAGAFEKEIGVPVQVVNMPGAASQVGMTTLANAKPDGYTLGVATLPALATTYLDPELKATYTRKSFAPVGLYLWYPNVLAVGKNSPYNTLKDFVDAAKAKPNQVQLGTTGLSATTHFVALTLQQLAGISLNRVHFDSSAASTNALIGGHIGSIVVPAGMTVEYVKSGDEKVLGIADKEQFKPLPGVKTFAEQGYNMQLGGDAGLVAPAGTPKEVIDTLSAALKKAMAYPDVTAKYDELVNIPRYLNPEEYAKYWDSQEAVAAKMLPLLKQQ